MIAVGGALGNVLKAAIRATRICHQVSELPLPHPDAFSSL